MAEQTGDVNWYLCDTCDGYVMVVLRDDGTTPMMLACRVTGDPERRQGSGCAGVMKSMMYPVRSASDAPDKDTHGNAIPKQATWEFYRPTSSDIDEMKRTGKWTEELALHLQKGGLAIRPIQPVLQPDIALGAGTA